MLSNSGTVKTSFLITFLFVFLVCVVYCIYILNGHSLLPNISKKNKKINNYELELKEATINYVDEYYPNLQNGEKLIIKLLTLRAHEYINLSECNGYSIVNKEVELKVESYVKCGDYESEEYNKDYE